MRTSGRILKAAPKRNAITVNETAPLKICVGSSQPGMIVDVHRATAASAALTAREASRRKAITSSIANETTLSQRSRRSVLRGLSDLICTPQTVLSADLRCADTPVARKISAAMVVTDVK